MLHFVVKGGIINMLNILCFLFKKKKEMSMEILKINVGGFRNISSTSLSLNKITALVGLNGYGKSNIMEAIDFGFDFIRGTNASKAALMKMKQCIPLLKSNVGKDYSFDILLKMETKNGSCFINYGYSFSWETEKHPSKIISEYLKIKKDDKNQKYISYISRNESSAKYKSSETGRCSKSINIENNALVLNKLIALDDLFYLDILERLNSIEFFIEKHLDASPSFAPDPFVVKGFQELELQGIQSIPRAIFFLKKDFSDKYELLINAFRQLFPDVIDVNVQEIKLNNTTKLKLSDDAPFVFTDSIYSMSIIDDKMVQPINFENLSDGTKRIFLMLTFAVIADIKNLSIISIEEPENSIHPNLLQNYLDVLSQLVNNCKIIISSHSPYIVQYLDPRCIYIGFLTDSGEAEFKKIASNKANRLIKDATTFNNSVGDYIFSILSSSDAEEYLKEYVENDVE